MTDSTASALIDAAEGLFASDGIEHASLREVMRRAGADPGAIHYHFGNRKDLAAAVLDRVLVPLNDRRLELLSELEAEAAHPSLEALVEALVRPDLELAAELELRGAGRAGLVGATYLNPAAFVTRQVEERFAPVAVRFHPHLIAALPDIDPGVTAWRVRWIVFGTLGALLTGGEQALESDPDEIVHRLVASFVAALSAPINKKEP